ncbi:hypothetical protein Ddye_018751 [Dipteronia dyeriana]|uniref:Uncharacterized protein n=1 Tax=Dipteronia dyeriana TaxID=168575 RepID=A0AAD9UBA2_9ROSI|nr:hypothetical protein Ddye_018751 [Dipteronia dyeriana]
MKKKNQFNYYFYSSSYPHMRWSFSPIMIISFILRFYLSFSAIGGVMGELLEENAQMFQQISANFAAFQIRESIDLISQARDNIFAVLNNLNDMPKIMKQMPPLPVKVNDIANIILPRTSHQMNPGFLD